MVASKKTILSSLKKIDVLDIFNLIPVHIYWKDKDGYYLGCNQNQASDMGLNSSEDMIGKTDYDLQPHKVAEELRRNDLKIMKSGVPATIEEDDFISTKIPLCDEDNKVIGILGVSINFKIHKSSRSILDKIISAVPGHVYWKDLNGVILGCNEQQAIDAGFKSRHEVVGKKAYDLINKNLPEEIKRQHAEEITAADNVVMESGVPSIFEEFVVQLDGTEGTYLSQKTPLYDDDGKITGLLGISVDITELKKAKEQAEAASQAKTEFVQNMQHDIRTPAAGMWGLLDVLTGKEQNPEHKKILKMATESSKRLLDLCNDAVEFGDLQSNAKPIMEEKIDPREIAKSVVELNLPAIFGKNLTLNFKVAANVPPTIISDPYRLSRMVINLVGNAVKFTDKGEVSLSLSARNKGNDRHGVLYIEVKDTGIGIAKNKIGTVFQKFSRGVASNTSKYPGTGLGLYVVKTFVDELDADIEFESHEGEGSRFKITLPIKIPHDNEGHAGTEINEKYSSPLNATIARVDNRKLDKESDSSASFQHKILIIEDDQVCLFAEKQMVSAFSAHIDTAENMRKALELLDLKHYDLVIADLGLPDGSGAEIAAAVRASTESPNVDTPFIAMTAHRDKEKHREALNAGFNEIATKPLTEQKVEQLLHAYPIAVDEEAEEDEDLEVIDLELTIKRLNAKNVKAAAVGLGLFSDSLKEDIPVLRRAEAQNDIEAVREVLHKVRGALYYSGTPCLEKAVVDLHAAVKSVDDLKKIAEKFKVVYEQAKTFEEYYQAMISENV